MPDKVLTTIKPRKYQQEIYENCKTKNCLVVLPTGIGKTLIALMLTINRQKAVPGTKALFLAPTRPLAEQHLEYFKTHLPELFAQMELFTGKVNAENRKKLWERADIVFSTPQCISNDLKNNLYNLNEVSLLIEDECHRCLKNYSYTYIAKKYHEQSENPRVLGLTASPGTDKKTIEKIALNLGIEAIELRTRDSEDVKEYLQELEFDIIKLEYPEEFKEISDLIRKIYERKVQELRNRKLLFRPANKISLLEVQGNLMRTIKTGKKNFNYFAGVTACAQAIKVSHLIELLETQTLDASFNYMKNIFQQASEKKSKASIQISRNPDFNKAFIKIQELIAKNLEHPKLLELVSIIEESIKNNPKNKTIVFSQYRDTVSKICEKLNKIKGINAKVFVGQAKKAGTGKSNTGLSQKEQQEIMQEFKQGKINIIGATSIAEEGLDIPEVNSVIFYEPIPSAIRSIQRRGRTARLMKGKLIILMTKNTLDEIFYYASRAKEKRMYKAIANIKDKLDKGKPLISTEEKQEKQIKEQKTLF
tara:strand:+ start:1624 stop:3225 length:1602 start_codon:yes stop_codon:yes gene_type:complete